ncbi:hypothetical protein QTG54_001551 [Skeletonema marinoi]|uniref:Uncharacterized protein n=1 Tax=Skeletonema marinoi TaxID=267567 RepID=A0AAD8YKB6_9STRA|nr:hypothetical protein QTG54_001551 [Skeletonema marinoi]
MKDEGDSNETNDATSKESSEGAIEQEEETSNQRSIKRLKSQLQHYKQQNEMEKKRRQKVVSSFVSFHTMYESGLDFIARMGDLRNVPDNVMGDEIPKL